MMIHLKPKSGLCNRMQAVDSAIALAHTLQTPLHVYWVTDHLLNCRFDRLWEIPVDSLIHIHAYSQRPWKFWRTHEQIRRIPLHWLPGPLTFPSNRTAELKAFDWKNQQPGKDILIESYSRFFPNPKMYAALHPIPELQDRIQARTALFNEYTMGVHIRRTDNSMSIKHSPDDLFVHFMQQEVDAHPQVNFYLATDALEIKKKFIEIFPDRIIMTPYPVTRNSEEGVREALVELYALANTAKILGSYWSSYSKVAGEIHGVEVVQAKSV